MKKNTPSSYVQMFEEKFKSKEQKTKTKETQPAKGINFDNLTDWDNISPLNDNNNNNNGNNPIQIHPEDIYTPIVFNPNQKQQTNPTQFHPIHQDFDNGTDNEEPNDKPISNRHDPLNDYSVNTSTFTYKQNDLGYCDKIDLSTMNNNNDFNNVIAGKRVPLAFCENMVMSQIHKASPEHKSITHGVIQEEDDEYRNCSKMTNDFLNEKKNANNERDSLDEIEHVTNKKDEDDLDGNITQDQMNELNEEMNQMLHEMKVKNYVEKKVEKQNSKGGNSKGSNGTKKKEGDGKIYLKQKENEGKIGKEGVKKENQAGNNSLQNAGLATGKFGCANVIPSSGNDINNNSNISPNMINMPMNLQGYPLSYIQQQQAGIAPITAIPIQLPIQMKPQQIYQDVNGYPIQYPQAYSTHYQIPYNMGLIPSNQAQNTNVNIYNQNTYLTNQSPLQQQQQQQPFNPTFKNIPLNLIPNQSDQSLSNQGNQPKKKTPQYHPKTMKEYKQKYINAPEQKRGGLGANIGTKEWEEKQQKANKIKQYSTQIKETIKERQPKDDIKPKENISKIPANVKYINKTNDEELKNQLLHDSLSDEDEDMKALNGLIKENNANVNNNSNDYSIENKIVKSANGHVNVIKNLKKDNEQKQSKDGNINYSKYKQVPVKNTDEDNKTEKNKVYTTMKQSQTQAQTPKLKQKRGKSLDPAKNCINRSRSSTKPKLNNQKNKYPTPEDHLTKEFMNQPTNDIISNLLQNHQAYNDKVNKIKMYLHNK